MNPKRPAIEKVVSEGSISARTLAFHGTTDRPFRLECFQEMDRYFPNGLKKVVIDGPGHYLHHEAANEVNPQVVEFLKSLHS